MSFKLVFVSTFSPSIDVARKRQPRGRGHLDTQTAIQESILREAKEDDLRKHAVSIYANSDVGDEVAVLRFE
jgi:hypothetical protein